MYPEEMVIPMKADLTEVGFESLTDADAVENAIARPGVTLMVVNSVCGCAAGSCRPAAKASLDHTKKPDHLVTVFAGVDKEAVDQARKHFLPYPPSSPNIAVLKDGKLVHFIERHHIEGATAEIIAANLKQAYDAFC